MLLHQTPQPAPVARLPRWNPSMPHLAPAAGSSTHACRMYFNRRSKKIHSEGGWAWHNPLTWATHIGTVYACIFFGALDIRTFLYVCTQCTLLIVISLTCLILAIHTHTLERHQLCSTCPSAEALLLVTCHIRCVNKWVTRVMFAFQLIGGKLAATVLLR